MLLWNILLALAWAAATGQFTPNSLAMGFILGYIVLLITRSAGGRHRYFVNVPQAIGFGLFYVWELILANLRVAYDVITPGYHMRPAVLAIPLDAKTDAEITILANLITLTPGTLSLDVSNDRRFLYIHAMYVRDIEEFRQALKDRLERRVLEVLR
jgi:multicomponent Na+:H+ antiporter subunit E